MEKEFHEPGGSAYKLYLSDFLREKLIHSVIRALQFPTGSRGLDIGCGIGTHTLMLARAVGHPGHVTGLDLSSDMLVQARKRAGNSDQREQVSFQEGNMNRLPFDRDTFDWIWSVDCAGYVPGDPVSLLKELARVVKPGGRIAILAWSSQQLLPGYPLLEAKLNATSAGIAPFIQGKRPESHFFRALGWFREAGIKECKARIFADSVHAPLGQDIRKALLSLFDMRWGDPGPELSQEDRQEYRRLCHPESGDLILNSPDYYAFFTYSLFQGLI